MKKRTISTESLTWIGLSLAILANLANNTIQERRLNELVEKKVAEILAKK